MRSTGGPAGDLAQVPQRIERLFALLLPALVRWTHRRLPVRARQRMDSGDLIQEACVGLLQHYSGLNAHDPNVLESYLHRSIQNRICDEVRRANKVEVASEATSDAPDPTGTPLDRVLVSENEERFQAALRSLDPDDQALVLGRVDRRLSYEALAKETGKPSAAAARIATRRAVFRLARLMGEGRHSSHS